MIKGNSLLRNTNILQPEEGQSIPKRGECPACWARVCEDPPAPTTPPTLAASRHGAAAAPAHCSLQDLGLGRASRSQSPQGRGHACCKGCEGHGEGAQGERGELHPPHRPSSPPRRSDQAPLRSFKQLQNHNAARKLPLTTGCEASYYHRCLNALTYIDILVQRLIITGYS